MFEDGVIPAEPDQEVMDWLQIRYNPMTQCLRGKYQYIRVMETWMNTQHTNNIYITRKLVIAEYGVKII